MTARNGERAGRMPDGPNHLERSAWWMLLALSCVAAAPPSPEQAAAKLLREAREAYRENDLPAAVGRFREFIAKFANHKDVTTARYGLALSLMDGPNRDEAAAAEQLQILAGNPALPERPYVLYHLGRAQRGLGTRELAAALAKPAETAAHRAAANQRFEEAAKQFTAALAAFAGHVKSPADREWSARARSDLAEMQIRTLKFKEAQATAEPFFKEPALAKSRSAGLGKYYYGLASWHALEGERAAALAAGRPFAAKSSADYQAALRALTSLRPFHDASYGGHARYVLGRLYERGGQGDQARDEFAGLVAADEQARADKAAGLDADDVSRAAFLEAVLWFEDGRFADALERFTRFEQRYPGSPLLADARLRQGACQAALGNAAAAVPILQPIADREPRLADQALLWLGRAQAKPADPANPSAVEQAVKTAQATLLRAAVVAQQLMPGDPEARGRRGEILLEVADKQEQLKQYAQAAATCAQVAQENLLPLRAEEVLERRIAALALAGDLNNSDQACAQFLQTYPKSPRAGAVLFRQAENAALRALEAERVPGQPTRAPLNDEAIKRYQAAAARSPKPPEVYLARYGMALGHYRKGEWEAARRVLEVVPVEHRTGPLAPVAYVLADCLIRSEPPKESAEPRRQRLARAAELLEGFLGAAETPEVPDALFKLGWCYQRLAGAARPPENAKPLADARAAYERLLQQYPAHPLQAQAAYERARCLAESGDAAGAAAELERFLTDPLKASPVAPAAVLELAVLLRARKKPAEAADLLAKYGPQYEPALLQDPARSGWALALEYQHATALREAGKLRDARGVFAQIVQQFPNRPEGADAALRWGECMRDEGLQGIAAARQTPAAVGARPEDAATANKALEEGNRALREAVQFWETQAGQWNGKPGAEESRARMLLEAARVSRTLAAAEVEAARAQLRQQQWQKLKDEAAKKVPPGQPPPFVAEPDVPRKAVPLQPADQKSRALYQALLGTLPRSPLAAEARLELADLCRERGEYDAALAILKQGLDPKKMDGSAGALRVRLAECRLEKGEARAALRDFDELAKELDGPLAAEARLGAGECCLRLDDGEGATTRLLPFRDEPALQNLPGVTDRALVGLGEALARRGRWEDSARVLETVSEKFADGPLAAQARYAAGWAWQHLGRYDEAVKAFEQVKGERGGGIAPSPAEYAARAQLQIGLCRMAQKRYADAVASFLVAPFTSDAPDLVAAALCEAGRGLVEMNQPDQAARLWERVVRDYTPAPWAAVARERLAVAGKR